MSDIELILHIGMGKTGTTSIQSVLDKNRDGLASRGVHYLGKWLDMLDPAFHGLEGTHRFMAKSPEERARYGAQFLDHVLALHRRTKAGTFILSSESLFNKPLIPFLRPLAMSSQVNARALVYVRNPAVWLESAYFQWGIRHKTGHGRIPPFRELVGSFAQQYDTLLLFHQKLGDRFVTRHYDAIGDVVADFLAQCGVHQAFEQERRYGRDEMAESLLRKEYNDIFPTPKLPNDFRKAVWGRRRPERVQGVAEAVGSFYDMEAMRRTIEERQETFAYLKDRMGLDLDLAVREPAPVEEDKVRDRLVEFLAAIVVRMGDRIEKLERRLEQMIPESEAQTPAAHMKDSSE